MSSWPLIHESPCMTTGSRVVPINNIQRNFALQFFKHSEWMENFEQPTSVCQTRVAKFYAGKFLDRIRPRADEATRANFAYLVLLHLPQLFFKSAIPSIFYDLFSLFSHKHYNFYNNI